MAAFDYKIIDHIATLSAKGNVTKELNYISYGGAEPKYDLRSWRTDGDTRQMLKGLTMTEDEIDALRAALMEMGS